MTYVVSNYIFPCLVASWFVFMISLIQYPANTSNILLYHLLHYCIYHDTFPFWLDFPHQFLIWCPIFSLLTQLLGFISFGIYEDNLGLRSQSGKFTLVAPYRSSFTRTAPLSKWGLPPPVLSIDVLWLH